ncbi:MAG: hypothetical protein SFT91_03000 [Rickettsiaceae bacterium]|nr:hypothetical protein [Rickettsiaceae bacterium]
MKKIALLSIIFVICNSFFAEALAKGKKSNKKNNASDEIEAPYRKEKTPGSEAYYQDIIDDYKSYLSSVPEETRNEIKEFRKEVAKLQKKKKDLYKKLSNSAQEYLRIEEGYRRKLPVKNTGSGIVNDEKATLKVDQINRK